MFNKSIAYRLSIYISLAVIAVFLIFIAVAYIFNSSILKENIKNKAIALGQQAMATGEQPLIATREITSNVADHIIYFARNDGVEFYLLHLMARYKYLNAMHVNFNSDITDIKFRNYYVYRDIDSLGYTKGNELKYNCINEKRIFESVKQSDTSSWTEEYACSRKGNLAVAFYSPIYITDKGNNRIQVGSVISELSLLEMADTINSYKMGESGFAFMVNQDGYYLSHPNKEYILKKNLFNVAEHRYEGTKSDLKSVLDYGKTGSVIAYPESMNNEKSWIFYTPIKETRWMIFFIVPYNELFVPLYVLILRMLFFSVLGILVIFFIITYISNRLIYPLSNITSQLKKFSSATGNIDLNSKNEVEVVSASLENIKSWYNNFMVSQYHEENQNRQRKQDLLEACEIQMSLINTDFSGFAVRKDCDLFALFKPARIVSGDLYDFLFLDDDNLYFAVGDVSGKGISAAFFMSIAQTLLKSNAKFKSPDKIVTNANNELFTNNQHQFFLTLFVGVINLKTKVMRYCNAAHTPTYIADTAGNITELNQSHGMPLGIYPNRIYSQSEIVLKQGDAVILYSDGVTDMQNESGKHYGSENLIKVLQQNHQTAAKQYVLEIENELEKYRGVSRPSDDVTIMIINLK